MDIPSIFSNSINQSTDSPVQSKKEPLAAYAAYLLILDTVSRPVENNALNDKRTQVSSPAAPVNSAKEKLGLGWHTIQEIYYVTFNRKRFRVRETKRYFTVAGVVVDASIDKNYTPVSSAASGSRDLLQNKILKTKDVSAPQENIDLSTIVTLLSTFRLN